MNLERAVLQDLGFLSFCFLAQSPIKQTHITKMYLPFEYYFLLPFFFFQSSIYFCYYRSLKLLICLGWMFCFFDAIFINYIMGGRCCIIFIYELSYSNEASAWEKQCGPETVLLYFITYYVNLWVWCKLQSITKAFQLYQLEELVGIIRALGKLF